MYAHMGLREGESAFQTSPERAKRSPRDNGSSFRHLVIQRADNAAIFVRNNDMYDGGDSRFGISGRRASFGSWDSGKRSTHAYTGGSSNFAPPQKSYGSNKIPHIVQACSKNKGVEDGSNANSDLTDEECKSLKDMARKHYKNGRKIWGTLDNQELMSYKEHYDIDNGHIEKVRAKSLEAAKALEAHFKRNNYENRYSANIDKRALEAMAIYHDTGMDGNIQAENYEAERKAYLSDESIRNNYVNAAVAKKEREATVAGKPFDRATEEIKANEQFEKEGFEKHFRSDHSLESAIHVLRDRESINDLNVNADEVALGCFVHSKSNSGLKHIGSEAEWRTAVKRLQVGVDEFNRGHTDKEIHFDSSFLVNEDDSFKPEKLAEMRSEAIALRIGDANGHDTNSKTSQAGQTIEHNVKEQDESEGVGVNGTKQDNGTCSETTTPQEGKSMEFSPEGKTVKEELPSDFESKFKNGDYEAYFLEVQDANVKVGKTELNNGNDPKGISRMFAVGEGNFKSLSCEADEDGTIRQTFEILNGNAFPLSTQHCIEERFAEYGTAIPLKYNVVIKLGGKCSEKVRESYRAFADRMKQDYKAENVIVEERP